MTIIYGISVLGSIICFIMVLIQLFKAKGALHGILGLICSLYTFIWGWINAKTLNLSKLMLIWTICSCFCGGPDSADATAVPARCSSRPVIAASLILHHAGPDRRASVFCSHDGSSHRSIHRRHARQGHL